MRIEGLTLYTPSGDFGPHSQFASDSTLNLRVGWHSFYHHASHRDSAWQGTLFLRTEQALSISAA
jgi:hypothetical protein